MCRPMILRVLTICVALLTTSVAHAAGTLEDRVFHSAALDADKHVMIYLPQGYDPLGDYNYPIIYYLHGAFSEYNTDAGMIRAVLDSEISSGSIQPLIAAMPSGSAGAFGGSMWANSVLYGRFEDYLTNDVRQFVETNYRVLADRSQRSIVGFSMGGMGSFNAAFRHPELYSAAASHSGALDYQHLSDYFAQIFQEAGGVSPYNYDPNNGIFTDLFFLLAGAWSPNLSRPPYFVDFPLDIHGTVIDSIYDGKWMPNGPQRLARGLHGSPALAIYFDCGTADDLLLYPFNTAFAESLTALGIPYRFRTIPGGHHVLDSAKLAVSFQFADSVMRRGIASGVGQDQLPAGYSGLHSAPTPSTGPVTVSFRVESEGPVTLDVLDVTGRRVARLLNGQLPKGMHQVRWEGARTCRTGVYFARLCRPTSRAVSTRIVLNR
jgi:S-formylglutathione hydrolase